MHGYRHAYSCLCLLKPFTLNEKEIIFSVIYNYGHNIWRNFDVLPTFSFPTSETKPDY